MTLTSFEWKWNDLENISNLEIVVSFFFFSRQYFCLQSDFKFFMKFQTEHIIYGGVGVVCSHSTVSKCLCLGMSSFMKEKKVVGFLNFVFFFVCFFAAPFIMQKENLLYMRNLVYCFYVELKIVQLSKNSSWVAAIEKAL